MKPCTLQMKPCTLQLKPCTLQPPQIQRESSVGGGGPGGPTWGSDVASSSGRRLSLEAAPDTPDSASSGKLFPEVATLHYCFPHTLREACLTRRAVDPRRRLNIYIYIFIYIYKNIYVCIYIYIHIVLQNPASTQIRQMILLLRYVEELT